MTFTLHLSIHLQSCNKVKSQQLKNKRKYETLNLMVKVAIIVVSDFKCSFLCYKCHINFRFIGTFVCVPTFQLFCSGKLWTVLNWMSESRPETRPRRILAYWPLTCFLILSVANSTTFGLMATYLKLFYFSFVFLTWGN